MTGYIPNILKEAARNLRKNMTKSEKIIWNEIKNKKLGQKFLRQKPIYLYTEISGMDRYIIPDFCSLDIKLILEIDGNIHDLDDIFLLDKEKEKLLINKGFKVIRITNDEIINDLNNVIKKIVSSFP
ncbi:MAG: DUF559 domain-containing protein [Candidatus Gracilibacteria bacterium]|nr:DUF559 domain-containing protein [Candidatus Gracilibacteria bacterium]